jgi:hypothetical protein
VDGSGNVAITGSGVGTFDFNGSNPLTLAPTTSQAIFAKFDSNGGYLWSKAFNEMPLGEEGEGVTFDSAGNVLFTGYTLSDIYDFAGVRSIQDGTADVFTVKFSATGDWKWAKRLSASAGFSGTDRGYGIAVDASNNVLTTGQFGGQGTGLDFGGGNITTGSASSYGFLLKVGP